ncbi:uncharacterized protein LOC112904616 [Agrilus planipennis]|uniref:Uncharacterized protein LOC112904616 n=1 Tax=Agrilus planipennis TaxID=224129 RepID=A0A7F5QZX0_AGRPL|nr:uncharacterized protein LOC112904616 [Agrilus planipennis]
MSEISDITAMATAGYYLPHHAVTKIDSSTTKLRVVFDGSSKSDTGISLNDIQLVDPTVQDDLFSILLRFRKHRYVLSGDIAKMYRQVLVPPDDRRYQRILWRRTPSCPIKHYVLNTMTYGTASAPYLATRCMSLFFNLCGCIHAATAPFKNEMSIFAQITATPLLASSSTCRQASLQDVKFQPSVLTLRL